MPHTRLKQLTMTLAALPLAVGIALAQEQKAPPAGAENAATGTAGSSGREATGKEASR